MPITPVLLAPSASPSHLKGQYLHRDALAGAIAGMVTKTAMAPIERVKLLLQLQNTAKNFSSFSDPVSTLTHTTKYTSASNAFIRVFREQGFLAFWRGNFPNVLRQAGSSATNFALKDYFREIFMPLISDNDLKGQKWYFLGSVLAGGLAGGAATTMFYPLEYARTRLAMDAGTQLPGAGVKPCGVKHPREFPNGIRDVVRKAIETDGVRGLYRGFGIALGGNVLFRALHMGGYDFVKNEVIYLNGNGNLGFKERYTIASVVSISAGTICYPIDSIRRRLMMQTGKVQGYSSSLGACRSIMASEGVRGFYRGLGPNVIRGFGSALLLVGYDEFKEITRKL